MSDDLDTTTINRVIRRMKRDSYEGQERRAPQPADIPKWAGIVIAIVAAVSGYATLRADVRHAIEDQQELNVRFVEWNKSISERVRELERAR